VSPHIDPKALQGALQRLHRAPPGNDLRHSLHEVCESTTELFGVAGCGLMTLDDEQVLRYVVATDEAGRALEKVQEETGEGPCVDSLITDVVVSTGDVTADERWPKTAAALRDTPVRAVLGLPVHVGGAAIGSLNIYRQEAYGWDQSEVDALQAFNRIVEHLVATAILAEARDEVVNQLQHALDHRVEIERAVGVLMGRHKVDPVTAFNLLRSDARSQRRAAIDIAREVLAELA
jgi:GAF domain-containing protein